jgi:hypothetical protein
VSHVLLISNPVLFPSMPNKKRIAAFFDFDKTLIEVDSASKEATTIIAEKYQNNVFSDIGLCC